MKRPKNPLIPEKTRQKMLELIDPVDPVRADSAIRLVIDEATKMLQDLGRKKPCNEKTVLTILRNHKALALTKLKKIFPEEKAIVNHSIRLINDCLEQVMLSQKGKTWK